ncbi:MAG: glycosyltransferase, partial [Candidatus Pacearchaeota archaeon]|nr:glycosyltransferase [Candidatus Pacearchaeota archaeon]
MKIALFHPWLKSKGGAERVVLEFLKNTKHNVDVYTWVYDKENTFEEFKRYKIKIIGPKSVKKFTREYILRGILFFFLSFFLKIPLKDYDAFFISSGGLAEFIVFRNYKPKKTYIYSHTILRAACEEDIKWNLKYRYKSIFSKLFYLVAVYAYKLLEKIAWKKIDVAIFNSVLSLKRAKEHNLTKRKKIFIIHPPINLENLKKVRAK